MSITANILRTCKDLQGGLDTFYIFPYVKYSRSQIVIDGQTLTSYPLTISYKVESDTASFSENSSFEGGSEKWDQSFSFDIPKTEVGSELYKLLRKNIMIIYTDRLGNNRILGLYNGLECTITNETGSEKASLNGYRVTATGLEDNQAYFLPVVNDVAPPNTVLNFVFQDGNNFIFQDSNNFIFQ